MQSQIGQVSTGQTTTPLLPAAGKDGGTPPKNDAKAKDTFQMVLAGTYPPARKPQDVAAETVEDFADPEIDTETQDDLGLLSADQDASDEPMQYVDVAASDSQSDLDEPASEDLDADPVSANATSNAETETADTPEAIAPGNEKRAVERPNTPEAPAATPSNASVPAWFTTARSDTVDSRPGRDKPLANPNAKQAVADVAKLVTSPRSAVATTPVVNQNVGDVEAPADISPKGASENSSRTVPLVAAAQQNKQMPAASNPAGTPVIPLAPGQVAKTETEPRHVVDRKEARENPGVTHSPQTAKPPSGPTPVAAAVPAAATPFVSGRGEGSDGKTSIRWMSELGVTSEVAATELQTPARVQQTALLQQPDLPRNIAAQIAQAMQHGRAERPMELVLSPAELGRVRISMQASEGGMTVQVIADRPETLDLMRRHIDVLAQEFHDIGFGSASFAFGHGAADSESGDGGSATENAHQTTADTEDDTDIKEPVTRSRLNLHSDRVDIRL